MRKGRPDKARKDTPLEELDQKETLMHYNAVIVEELRSNMQLVLECVRSNSQRLAIVEQAIHALKEDMLDMERRICSKINRMTERCQSHESRIGALEAHT